MKKLLLLLPLLGACTVVERPCSYRAVYPRPVLVTEFHHERYHSDWGPVHAEAWVTTATTKVQHGLDFRATGCTNLNPNVCAARGW